METPNYYTVRLLRFNEERFNYYYSRYSTCTGYEQTDTLLRLTKEELVEYCNKNGLGVVCNVNCYYFNTQFVAPVEGFVEKVQTFCFSSRRTYGLYGNGGYYESLSISVAPFHLNETAAKSVGETYFDEDNYPKEERCRVYYPGGVPFKR